MCSRTTNRARTSQCRQNTRWRPVSQRPARGSTQCSAPDVVGGHVPYKATFLTTSSGTNFIFAACSPRVRVLLSCPGGIRAIQVEQLVCVIDSPLSASCSPSTGCTRLRAAEQMSPCSPRGMYGMRRQARSPIQPEMIHSPDQSCMLIQPGGPPAS